MRLHKIVLLCVIAFFFLQYKNKFGFVVSSQKTTYDSDAESDDEGEPYYYMTLDLSTVSGGKKRRKRKTKKNRKYKRKQTRKH